MTEEEKFLRTARNIYDSITPIDSSKVTKIDKLKEIDRWQNDFFNKTNAIEKMLNDHIMFGLIPKSDEVKMRQAIIEINNSYLK